MYQPGASIPVLPHSPNLDRRVWWGAGTRETAKWAGQVGVNLMSSTLLTESNGDSFGDLQAQQLQVFKESFASSGHGWTPRTSVSRSIFPITSAEDRAIVGTHGMSRDHFGVIDGYRSTFGRTYIGEPDQLIEELLNDAAVAEADTLMLTIPNQLGVEANVRLLKNFATHVAPALGWEPSTSEDSRLA